jgi:arginyl-tRNA--protein-N-Asp/Glu arginylyltransferase
MTGHTRTTIPESLAFYASEPHQCNYLPDRSALTVFADPNAIMNSAIYSRIIDYGFRRSGEYVYIPRCPGCDACLSVRIPAEDFKPDRNQRRILKKNSDLAVHRHPPVFNKKHYQLYKTYIQSRHQGGGMDNPTPKDYIKFLTSSWSHTVFYEFKAHGRLLAVSVVDQLHKGLSAVYTYFDPAEYKRSLGNYAILWLIEETRLLNLNWLYLGYYISDCQKMMYKSHYRPLEAFINGRWCRFNKNAPITG